MQSSCENAQFALHITGAPQEARFPNHTLSYSKISKSAATQKLFIAWNFPNFEAAGQKSMLIKFPFWAQILAEIQWRSKNSDWKLGFENKQIGQRPFKYKANLHIFDFVHMYSIANGKATNNLLCHDIAGSGLDRWKPAPPLQLSFDLGRRSGEIKTSPDRSVWGLYVGQQL